MMYQIFTEAFAPAFMAVIKILIIVLAGGIAVRKKLITETQIKSLSAITVRILLPCMILASIIKDFHPAEFKIWPLLPLAAVAIIALGLTFAYIIFAGKFNEKKNLFSLASMGNSGYLVLPIGAMLFPDQFVTFKLYCFLYIMGISPLLWTLGKYLVTSTPDTKFKISELLTPPFIAIVLALTMVVTNLRSFLPGVLLDSIELIGSATVPLATIILGAVLGSISLKLHHHARDAAAVILIKMLLLPACVVIAMYYTGLANNYQLLASFLIIESVTAPATAAILQVKHYGGDQQKIGSIILLSYIVYIFAMPLWLAVWKMMSA